MASYDELGREVPDPRPVEVPAVLRAPLTLEEQIRRAVRLEVSGRAQELGAETFEEADDFDVDDDSDEFISAYEVLELRPEPVGADASNLARPEPPLPSASPSAGGPQGGAATGGAIAQPGGLEGGAQPAPAQHNATS